MAYPDKYEVSITGKHVSICEDFNVLRNGSAAAWISASGGAGRDKTAGWCKHEAVWTSASGGASHVTTAGTWKAAAAQTSVSGDAGHVNAAESKAGPGGVVSVFRDAGNIQSDVPFLRLPETGQRHGVPNTRSTTYAFVGMCRKTKVRAPGGADDSPPLTAGPVFKLAEPSSGHKTSAQVDRERARGRSNWTLPANPPYRRYL